MANLAARTRRVDPSTTSPTIELWPQGLRTCTRSVGSGLAPPIKVTNSRRFIRPPRRSRQGLLSRAYRKDSIPQPGRETAALRDFKPALAETRVGARPVPAAALQNRMVGFPGTGRTELAELKGGDQAPHRRRLALTRGSDRFDGLNDRPPLVTGRVVRSCFRETRISREIGISPNSEATTSMEQNMEGGCTCQRVRYRLIGTPLIVHACHCRWCQRETGTAHALNALYEADRYSLRLPPPEQFWTAERTSRNLP
jgi:hypothetical protein